MDRVFPRSHHCRLEALYSSKIHTEALVGRLGDAVNTGTISNTLGVTCRMLTSGTVLCYHIYGLLDSVQ